MSIFLESDQLEIIQRILKVHFEGLAVYAYGPRVSGVQLTPDVELNITVVSDRPISVEKMIAVEKAFFVSDFTFSTRSSNCAINVHHICVFIPFSVSE